MRGVNLRLDLTNSRDAGRGSPRTFEFESGPVTIGRSAQSLILIEGDGISRTHVTLDLLHGAWHATHQGSLTPTLVNGVAIPHGQPRRVQDGDTFVIAEYVFRASYGRETILPEVEPMRDSSADMTMARASFMTQVAGAEPTHLPAGGAEPGPAGRVVPTLVACPPETGRLELRELERAYVIGRAAGCDLTVANGSVSRRHALARYDGTRIYIRAAGARNPLRVNGRPIFGETPLAHGDIVGVGPVDVRVVTEADAAAPASSASVFGARADAEPVQRETRWAPAPAPSPEVQRGPGPRAATDDPPRWDQVAHSAAQSSAPDWSRPAAAPPPPAPAPPPYRPASSDTAPAAATDWTAAAAAPRAAAGPASWDVPAAPVAPAPPPPAWDVPAGGAPPGPSWSGPPPVGPSVPPPPPPPVAYAAAPPPAIPHEPAVAPRRESPAPGAGPSPRVVARRGSSHKGWLVTGVVSMIVAITAGIVLLVVASARG